jgi:hypothetical protein
MAARTPYVALFIAIVALIALVTWLSIPGRPLRPTLPEIGPGARRDASPPG